MIPNYHYLKQIFLSIHFLISLILISHCYIVFQIIIIFLHYGTAPVDPRRPQNRGSHDYLRAHKGSRRMSRPLIQDSSVSVLFPRYKGNLT